MGMAFNPIDNNEIYAVVDSDPGQVFRSSNGGQTWQRIALLKSKFYFGEGYLYDMAVDPLNPNTIYAVGYYGLFKSINHGSSWKEITGTISLDITSLVVDSVSPKTIYAGTFSGIYRSDNEGSFWKETPSDFDTSWIKIDPASTKTIYAGELNGIYCSQNKGSAWQALNNGLVIDFAFCFDMNMVSKILYAGTSGGGVKKKF